MYDGSIVSLNGALYKRSMGQWVLLTEDPGVRYPDEWMMRYDLEVVVEGRPLADVAEGTVVSCGDGSVVAVYQGAGYWTISGDEEEFTTDTMLKRLGTGWKVIYNAGE